MREYAARDSYRARRARYRSATRTRVYAGLIRRNRARSDGPGQRDAARRLNLERAICARRSATSSRCGDAETATDSRAPVPVLVAARILRRAARLDDGASRPRAGRLGPRARRSPGSSYVAWPRCGTPRAPISRALRRGPSVCSRSPRTTSESRCRRAARGRRRVNRSTRRHVRAAADELTRSVAAFRAAQAIAGARPSRSSRSDASPLAMGHLSRRMSLFDQALACGDSRRRRLHRVVAMHHIGRMQLFAGQTDAAAATFRDSLASVDRAATTTKVWLMRLEGLSAIAALGGDLDRAGVLAGAAETIRQRVTMFDSPASSSTRATSMRSPGRATATAAARRRRGARSTVRTRPPTMPSPAPRGEGRRLSDARGRGIPLVHSAPAGP